MSWKGYPIRHSVGRPIKQPRWFLHLKGFGGFLFMTLLVCIVKYPWWFHSDFAFELYYRDVALGIFFGIVMWVLIVRRGGKF